MPPAHHVNGDLLLALQLKREPLSALQAFWAAVERQGSDAWQRRPVTVQEGARSQKERKRNYLLQSAAPRSPLELPHKL